MTGANGSRNWGAIFQDAALEPDRWLSALRVLADATGSARAQMIGIGAGSTVAFNWVHDFDADKLADFVRLELASPHLNYRTHAGLRGESGAVVHEADYRKAKARLVNDTYLDFCRDLDIPWGCQTNLIEARDGLVGLALLRTERDGMTSATERDEFARAAESARAAVRLQRAVEQQGYAILTGALDAMTAACLLLDGNGRVNALTPSGERAIAAEPMLRHQGDGTLSSGDPAVARALALALRAVLAERRPDRVALGENRRLDLFPLARRDWSLGFAPAAVAVFRDPDAELRAAAAQASEQFDLSPAEASVITLLAGGRSRREIAAARGTSEETLKSQLRSIYAKTGCTREPEILALLARLR